MTGPEVGEEGRERRAVVMGRVSVGRGSLWRVRRSVGRRSLGRRRRFVAMGRGSLGRGRRSVALGGVSVGRVFVGRVSVSVRGARRTFLATWGTCGLLLTRTQGS